MKEVIINIPDGYVPLIPSEYEKVAVSEIFDINVLFWKEIFSDANIKKTIEYAELRYKNSIHIPLKVQVILCDTLQ